MNKPPEYDNLPKLINYRKVDTNLIFENKSPSLISNINTTNNTDIKSVRGNSFLIVLSLIFIGLIMAATPNIKRTFKFK